MKRTASKHLLIRLHEFLVNSKIGSYPFFIRWPIKLWLLSIAYPLKLVSQSIFAVEYAQRRLFGGSVAKRASLTSSWVTFMRFTGNLADQCDDDLAAHFLSLDETVDGLAYVLKSVCFDKYDVHRFISGRCQFGDDAIRKATKEGIKQIVILGAGNDTRLHRLPDLPEALFEVDAPATQKFKLIALTGLKNNKVKFVAANFEKESWLQKLVEAGFDPKKKSLIIWDGVSYYLTDAAIRATLSSIAKCAKGTRLVFDFGTYKKSQDPEGKKQADRLLQYMKNIGEPWFSIFKDDEMVSLLNEYKIIPDHAPIGADVPLKNADKVSQKTTFGTETKSFLSIYLAAATVA